jgi:hypothetical protein
MSHIEIYYRVSSTPVLWVSSSRAASDSRKTIMGIRFVVGVTNWLILEPGSVLLADQNSTPFEVV